MADSTVGIKQDDSPDRLIDNSQLTNTAGDTVHRQRVALGDPDVEDRLAAVDALSRLAVLDAAESVVKATATASSNGNNTIHTPSAGTRIRLYFFGYSAGANVTGVLAELRFAAAGTIFDRQYLSSAGQPYARNVFAGKHYVEGGLNEALIVTLDAAQTVYVNVELEEV